MLGGSSAINFYVSDQDPMFSLTISEKTETPKAWSIPPSQDINAWEKLGNPGWNWETYSRNVKKNVKSVSP